MTNLFTSQTPSITDASDGTPGITLGTSEEFTTDGVVNGIWFYATATVSGSYSVALWRIDSSDPGGGTQLAGKVLGSAPTAGTWNNIAFDTPVSVTTGVGYRAVVFSGAGRYVATVGFFTGTPLTNGSATAPAHNGTAGPYTVSQGTFRINATTDYPNSSGGGTCYFVAADYVPDDDTVYPNGLAVPVALGAPSSAYGLSAAPSGLTVPVALGAPSSAYGLSATPNGLAVPVALGAPSSSVAYSVAPDGLAVPTVLGVPSSAYGLSAAPNGIAVPVALGGPSITFVANPNGLAIPVSLGEPEVTRVHTGGGWSDLAGIIEGARQDAALATERRRHPIDCPDHQWPLEQNSRGILHCKFGGHTVQGSR